jgi:hypothetical protein
VQYTGLLLIVFFGLCSAYLIARRRINLWINVAAFASIVLLFLPGLPVMLDQRSVGIPGAGKVDPSSIATYFLDNLVILFPFQVGHRILWALVPLLVIAGAVYFMRSFRAIADVKPLVLFGAVILLALCEAVVIAPVARYLFIVGPFAWIVTAIGIVSAFEWAWKLERSAPPKAIIALLGVAVAIGSAVDLQYSLSLGSQPKSGVPALIAFLHEKKIQPSFYIVTPDYIASSVGYYTRNESVVHLFGFAHWDHPEISTLRGQAALWSDQAIVAKIEGQIKTLPRTKGDIFAVVAQEAMTQHGSVHTEKSNVLVRDLLKQYRLAGYERFPGKYESVALYLFR